MRRYIAVIIVILMIFACNGLNVSAEDENDFRFALMGCLHYNGTNIEDLELAISTIKQYNPDFVMFLGSIVDVVGDNKVFGEDVRPSTVTALRQNIKLKKGEVEKRWHAFDKAAEELKKQGIKIYDIPSERSIPANNVAIAEESFKKRYMYRYYSFVHKSNLFIMMDSEGVPQKRGRIGKDQLEFLQEEMGFFEEYNNVFVGVHKNMWTKGWRAGSNWFEDIHPLINGKVEYVFGACAHFLDKETIDDVTYVTSGTAPVWPGEETKPSFFYFLLVTVNGRNVNVEVVPIAPIPIENLQLEEKDAFKKKLTSVKGRVKHALGYRTFLDLAQDVKRRLSKRIGEDKKDPKVVKKKSSTKLKRKMDNPKRLLLLKIDEVIKVLKIRPGMKIADIGAGTGIFAFPMAKKLEGKGMVYATETDKTALKTLETIKKEKGAKNVEPVLVKKIYVDNFYKEHVFDIIFLGEVYELIPKPLEYFSVLRNSLKKGSGRLYIIYYRIDAAFTEMEFDDYRGIERTISAESKDFPIVKRMRPETLDALKNRKSWEITSETKQMILEDFNTMLEDRTLFHDLDEYFRAKNPGSTKKGHIFLSQFSDSLAADIVKKLNEKGTFSKNRKTLSEYEKKYLKRLNRMAIVEIFKDPTLKTLFSVDGGNYVSERELIQDMGKAGYKYMKTYKFLPYHDLFEFKKSK